MLSFFIVSISTHSFEIYIEEVQCGGSRGGCNTMYNITFQQIEAFLTVSKYLSLSKAGKALLTSQPALSKTLRRFEEAVGMTLFTRSKQGMALTSAGTYLLSVLEPLYKIMDKSIRKAQDNSTTPLKVLHIVEPSTYDCMKDFDELKETVLRYEDKYPEVKVHEVLCDFKELRQALEFGNADIVFTEDFAVRGIPDISMKLLSSFDMYVAISGKHPLAQSDEMDFRALGGETLYTIPTMSSKQEDIDMQLSVCSGLGFKPKKIEFLPNFQSIMHTIQMGKGICICTKLNKLTLDFQIKYYPINMTDKPHIAVAWRNGRLSREVKSFLDMLPGGSHAVRAHGA
jgi:DNA-binding transcriptional LysR family regulator